MTKTLVVMTIGSILSGCALFKHPGEPLCLPSRPTLEPISIEEQLEIPPQTVAKLSRNEGKLKSHVVTIERITEEHNKQFKAECAD